MKSLSLWQPWAQLCVIGAKQFETRHWSTTYRGPLLIHAAKKWNLELFHMASGEPFHGVLRDAGMIAPRPKCARLAALPFGCIVGIVDLVECYRTTSIDMVSCANGKIVDLPTGNERDFGDFYEGRFAWQLANPRRFTTPIPYRGLQQLFNVPDALVADQLRTAVPA